MGLYGAAIWIGESVLIAALAQVISACHRAQISLDARLSPPTFFGGRLDHLLGIDELGRDDLARLIYSIQISMLVAVGGIFISTLLGVSFGLLAAERGGLIDEGVMAFRRCANCCAVLDDRTSCHNDFAIRWHLCLSCGLARLRTPRPHRERPCFDDPQSAPCNAGPITLRGFISTQGIFCLPVHRPSWSA
ncbi:hypothetical protein IVB12_09480 [Bradyrhizobium sp. 179]|uniref:hypothetical protein n=1 Tax=Bradyrhizobium sp. 179 TaxID=2782648 RepID=UPI001FF75D08|nr:hypothetical protein [Bradyrhizobium sp. 179]MCK1542195.1 hypothetical protein [Bradyrhizobium sp. 179]